MVTGATGFIGQRLIPLLIKGYNPREILCLVWNKDTPRELAARKFLKKLGVVLRLVDLVDKNTLIDLPENPKVVFHLAATTDTAKWDHRCNNIGTRNLVSSLTLGESTTFIYVGTSAMYCGRSNCQRLISESSTPIPSNNYGRSKLEAEMTLKEDCRRRKYSLTILRPPTVYGSNPRDNSLFDFLKKLIRKGSILARINWPGLTSLVWVDDMAKIIVWASRHHRSAGTVNEYIVSSEALTLAEISKLMHKKMGITYREIILPNWVWLLGSWSRKIVYLFDNITPPWLYNLAWRASLVVDNVIYCDSKKLMSANKRWKPVQFKERLNDVI